MTLTVKYEEPILIRGEELQDLLCGVEGIEFAEAPVFSFVTGRCPTCFGEVARPNMVHSFSTGRLFDEVSEGMMLAEAVEEIANFKKSNQRVWVYEIWAHKAVQWKVSVRMAGYNSANPVETASREEKKEHREVCTVLAEMRGILAAGKVFHGGITAGDAARLADLVEEAQGSVDRLVNALDVGSHVRCPKCEWNGGVYIKRGCRHCDETAQSNAPAQSGGSNQGGG